MASKIHSANPATVSLSWLLVIEWRAARSFFRLADACANETTAPPMQKAPVQLRRVPTSSPNAATPLDT